MNNQPASIFHHNHNSLHYWLTGTPDGPLLVLTHGATMDHRMFASQVALLAPHYRLLLWDVRGHGLSQPLCDDFSIRMTVYDLIALLDYLQYEQAAFIGHSMGGYISQELAFLYPERVIALVTMDCTCITLKHRGLDELGMNVSPLFLSYYPYWLFKRQASSILTVTSNVQTYIREGLDRLSLQQFITIWSAVMQSIHPEPDYTIQHPLLITYGQYNRMGPIGTMKRQTRRWAERDSHGHYVMIPNAGHNPHQDNPDYFNRLLWGFLQEYVPVKAE
ncbi:MAG: alpha/beta hydrolase [Chloroflexota bacterium]